MDSETVYLLKLIDVSLMSICGLVITLIMVVELCNYIKEKDLYAKIFNILSTLVYFNYFLFIIAAILNVLSIPNGPFVCKYLTIINLVSLFLAKGIYYTIFVVRLHIIFRSSSELQYSPKFLFSLFLIIIIFSISLSVAFAYEHSISAYYDHSTETCIASIPYILTGITILFDLTISILSLYLFIKKLRLIINNSDNNHIKTLHDVILKSSVLVIVAISSTFIVGAVYSVTINLGLNVIFQVDLVINSLSIVLMKSKYDGIYQTLCYIPQRCVSCCCMKRNNKKIVNRNRINSNTDTNVHSVTMTQPDGTKMNVGPSNTATITATITTSTVQSV